MITLDGIGRVAEQFRLAAVGAVTWENALNRMADLTGTRSGQLIGLGAISSVPMNIMTRLPDEAGPEFVQIGGGDPTVNSRVRVGMSAPEMVFLDQGSFDLEGDRTRAPEFGAWIDRYSIGYSCITTLLKRSEMLVGLAAIRSISQGEMAAEQKRAFMTVAAHARAAMVMRNTVEDQAVSLLDTALNRLRAAAVICDPLGKVKAITEVAEQIIATERILRLADGMLMALRPAENRLFQRYLMAALRSRVDPSVGPPSSIGLTGASGETLTIEFVPLPAQNGFNFAAAVMVVLQPNCRQPDLLRQVHEVLPLGGSSFRTVTL